MKTLNISYMKTRTKKRRKVHADISDITITTGVDYGRVWNEDLRQEHER